MKFIIQLSETYNNKNHHSETYYYTNNEDILTAIYHSCCFFWGGCELSTWPFSILKEDEFMEQYNSGKRFFSELRSSNNVSLNVYEYENEEEIKYIESAVDREKLSGLIDKMDDILQSLYNL